VLRLADGKVDDAIKQLVACVTMTPDRSGYWLALGVALGRAHRYDEADQAFRTCLELDPQDTLCRDDLKALIGRRPLPPPPVEAPKL